MILILSHRADPHVPMVTRHLDDLGERWSFVAAMELGDGAGLSWQLDDGDALDHGTLVTDGERVEMAEVRTVWNRRLLQPHLGQFAEDAVVRQYAQEQWWHALHGVLSRPGPRWVNPVAALASARSKPRQLVDARRAGLVVPPTLVSADAAEIRAFARSLGGVGLVTKVVSPGSPIVAEGVDQYMVFTERVDVENLDDDAVRAAPAIYQPELAKAFEVRVTVVGARALGCRIDSTASERTSLDWRHYDFGRVAHTPIQLPGSVERGLLALCRGYGLRYGAADFIVGPDGTWTFLELNPNGQWGWIEEQAGIPIGRHLAAELAGQAS